MTRNKLIISSLLLLLFFNARAQEFGQDSLADPKIEQAKGMVQTLAYYFNLLGGNRASVSEKETIINSSYLKLFDNERVQVEDDLQEGRSSVIYKDIQAYLKDIDFFFEEAYFEFEIENVERLIKSDSTPYYQVELIRSLEAVSLAGDSLNTTKKRFVELNMDTNDELKIASIYTTKLSKEKQLREWWATLTLEWKKVFQERLGVYYDSLSSDELFDLVTLDSLDISDNDLILDLEPIYQLTALKHLKISNTWINDLRPLLAINNLQSLDVSNTSVFDLQYLKYHKDIRRLNLSNSHVEDFSVLKNFSQLSHLNINGIAGIDLNFISNLKSLTHLWVEDAKGIGEIDFSELSNLSDLYAKNSDLNSLVSVGKCKSMRYLDVSGTEIISLEGLDAARKLQVLRMDNTNIQILEPIYTLQELESVYANGTSLNPIIIMEFAKYNGALLINNSDELKAWWGNIPKGLKIRLSDLMETNSPSVEELSELIRIDQLDLSQTGLQGIESLSKFQSLRELDLGRNRISTIDGNVLSSQLEKLILNGSTVNELINMDQLQKLSILEARNTAISSMAQLIDLPKLAMVDLDGANINEDEVAAALAKNPNLSIRFKTEELMAWWADLVPAMKRSLQEMVGLSAEPNSDELHDLIARKSLSFEGVVITDGFNEALIIFYQLTGLSLKQVNVNQIGRLPDLPELERLSLLQMPISDLTGLVEKYPLLKSLTITNTAVEDLRPLEGLTMLEYIDCSGTQVRRLRGLETLVNLKEIDCSNTRVFRLDRLEGLSQLSKLTCFNTGLRQNDIDKLLEILPDLEVVYY